MVKLMNIQEILNDPSTSFWLKDAIRQCDSRDPVDVLNDLEVLNELTEQRLRLVSSPRHPIVPSL